MIQTSTLPKEHPLLSSWRVSDLTPAEFAELGSASTSAGEPDGKLTLSQLRYLAQFGLLAPTSHNTIPQRLRLDEAEGAMDVCVERANILRHSDEKGRQALVSLGCVIANLELATEAVGWRASVRITETDAKDYEPPAVGQGEGVLPVARIEFSSAGTGTGTPWLELMRDRKVLRAEYDRSVALPDELAATLRGAVEQQGAGVELEVLSKSLALRGLGKFQEQADRFVLENKRFSRELGEWLLPNDEQQSQRAMRGYEFGFDDEFSQHIHAGLLGETLLLPDQVGAFARGSRAGLESSSAVLVLTTAGDSLAERVNAGRVGQRLMLLLQQGGFCSAVHAALTEVEWVSRIFAATVLRTTRRPMMLFRTGQAKRDLDRSRPHSVRPPLDEILL